MRRLQLKGRWGDPRTARLYVDEAAAELGRISYSEASRVALEKELRYFQSALDL